MQFIAIFGKILIISGIYSATFREQLLESPSVFIMALNL